MALAIHFRSAPNIGVSFFVSGTTAATSMHGYKNWINSLTPGNRLLEFSAYSNSNLSGASSRVVVDCQEIVLMHEIPD